MYRIIDVDAALAYARPRWDAFVLRLAVADPLLPDGAGSYVVRFGAGGRRATTPARRTRR